MTTFVSLAFLFTPTSVGTASRSLSVTASASAPAQQQVTSRRHSSFPLTALEVHRQMSDVDFEDLAAAVVMVLEGYQFERRCGGEEIRGRRAPHQSLWDAGGYPGQILCLSSLYRIGQTPRIWGRNADVQRGQGLFCDHLDIYAERYAGCQVQWLHFSNQRQTTGGLLAAACRSDRGDLQCSSVQCSVKTHLRRSSPEH